MFHTRLNCHAKLDCASLSCAAVGGSLRSEELVPELVKAGEEVLVAKVGEGGLKTCKMA